MKVYVGTYGKYNAGNLSGEWIDLDNYSNMTAFLSSCEELHEDEENPELWFQDFEYTYEWERIFYSESYISPLYWHCKELCQQYDIDPDALGLYLDYICFNPNKRTVNDLTSAIKECADRYLGTYSSKERYEEYVAEESGLIDECGFINNLPESFRCYCSVDWEKMARDDTDTVALSNGKGKVYIFNMSFREE